MRPFDGFGGLAAGMAQGRPLQETGSDIAGQTSVPTLTKKIRSVRPCDFQRVFWG